MKSSWVAGGRVQSKRLDYSYLEETAFHIVGIYVFCSFGSRYHLLMIRVLQR